MPGTDPQIPLVFSGPDNPTLEPMLASLRNLGPKSVLMLRQAGISTVKELRELGAVKAYAIVKRSGANASLNLLWAIEGALSGRTWQEVARSDRLSLLLLLEQEQVSEPDTKQKARTLRPGRGPHRHGLP